MSMERQTEIMESLASKTYSTNFTRPNDNNQYAINDVVSNSTTTPVINEIETDFKKQDSLMITNAKILIAHGTATNMLGFRIALFSSEPASLINDNAAFNLTAGDRSKFIGYVDIGVPVDLGDTVFGQSQNINHQITLVDGSIYFQLITLGTETPGALVVYTIYLDLLSLKG